MLYEYDLNVEWTAVRVYETTDGRFGQWADAMAGAQALAELEGVPVEDETQGA